MHPILQAGRLTCCTAVDDDASVATGSAAGSLHVWRVETVGRPGAAPDKYTGELGDFYMGLFLHVEVSAWDISAQILQVLRRGFLYKTLSAWSNWVHARGSAAIYSSMLCSPMHSHALPCAGVLGRRQLIPGQGAVLQVRAWGCMGLHGTHGLHGHIGCKRRPHRGTYEHAAYILHL